LFFPEAFGGPVKERGQPYMQLVIIYGTWYPHLGAGYMPTNPKYVTSAILEYGRPHEDLFHLQIPVLDMSWHLPCHVPFEDCN
jgi:hypothetical protein